MRELTDGSLEIIDGHLRQSLDPELVVPVLILDLDEAEAAKLLLSLDPLAGMAGIFVITFYLCVFTMMRLNCSGVVSRDRAVTVAFSI